MKLLLLLALSLPVYAMDTHVCEYWLHMLGEQEYLESLFRYHVSHGETDKAKAILKEIRKAQIRNGGAYIKENEDD